MARGGRDRANINASSRGIALLTGWHSFHLTSADSWALRSPNSPDSQARACAGPQEALSDSVRAFKGKEEE